jgi:CRP-like cAMP-binding protein
VKTKPGLQFDPIAFLAKTGESKAVSSYAIGQAIFAQGDPADAVFYVQAGQVKLTVVSAQGKEAVVGIFSATDFFGDAGGDDRDDPVQSEFLYEQVPEAGLHRI